MEIGTHLRKAMVGSLGLASLYEYLCDDELDARKFIADIKKDPDAVVLARKGKNM